MRDRSDHEEAGGRFPFFELSREMEGAVNVLEGKARGLDAVSDKRGIIRVLAVDHRGSLKRSFSSNTSSSPGKIGRQRLEEFKDAVVEILGPYCSGVMLDPEYRLGASGRNNSVKGLLLAYENSGYDNVRGGRIPSLLVGWTVRRSIELGADCIKVLIHYSPFDKNWVRLYKQAFVERVGAECVCHKIPLLLGIVGYDCQGLSDLEYARAKPEMLTRSIREFSKDRYHVDILGVEIPVDLKFVSGTPFFQTAKPAYALEEARKHFREAAAATEKPLVYFSSGVTAAWFREGLRVAIEAGADFSGVVCGRATWGDGIPVYLEHGVSGFREWLADRGVQNIKALNEVLEGARPWRVMEGRDRMHWLNRLASAVSMD